MPKFSSSDVGKRVVVQGHDGVKGTIRFVGEHAEDGTARVGVEMDDPVGKNNGKVKVSDFVPPTIYMKTSLFKQTHDASDEEPKSSIMQAQAKCILASDPSSPTGRQHLRKVDVASNVLQVDL